MSQEQAIDNAVRFLAQQSKMAEKENEAALMKIAHFRWWEIWKARDIARRTLCIFEYWDREIKESKTKGE